MSTTRSLSISEAVFVSGLKDRELNRVIDERLIPKQLIIQAKSGRRFSILGVAFAKFYFGLAPILSATCRKEVICRAHENVRTKSKDDRIPDEVLSGEKSWEIRLDMVTVDIAPFVRGVYSNLRLVDTAEQLIVQDDSVMSGRPVFKGTRLPIDMVVDSKGWTFSLEEAQEAYPFLTKEQFDAARIYCKLHPPRGRPRRLVEVNAGLEVLSK